MTEMKNHNNQVKASEKCHNHNEYFKLNKTPVAISLTKKLNRFFVTKFWYLCYNILHAMCYMTYPPNHLNKVYLRNVVHVP